MDVHGGVIESDEWAGRNANPSILAVMEALHRSPVTEPKSQLPSCASSYRSNPLQDLAHSKAKAPCCSLLARCGAAQNDSVLLSAGLLCSTRLRVLLIPPFVSVPVARLILMLHYINRRKKYSIYTNRCLYIHFIYV